MRALLVAVSAFSLGAFLLPANAAAGICSPVVEPLVTLSGPEQVAYGRHFALAISKHGDYFYNDYVEQVHATLEPLRRNGRLSFSLNADLEPADFQDNEDSLAGLRFLGTDGPARLTVSWTQGERIGGYDGEAPQVCPLWTSLVVRPVKGALSPVHPLFARSGGSRELEIEVPCQRPTSLASPAPVFVIIRGLGARREVPIPDACRDSSFKRFQTRKWTAYRTGFSPRQRISISSFGVRRASRLTFLVRQSGRVTARGHFRVVNRDRPARKIFEGTDAFINYCINELRTIRSLHGRLYCVYPGRYRTIASGLHWSGLARR